MAELNDKLISYGNLSTFYDKLQEQGCIEEVSELPNASENKNKLFRLDNGDKDVYAAKLIGSETTTTNRLPDAQQIDKAYLYEVGEPPYYYKGSFKVIFSDTEIDGYGWLKNGETIYFILTEDNAENVQSDSIAYGFFTSEDDTIDLVNKTITTEKTSIETKCTLVAVSVSETEEIPIPATYNAPESKQIGNAYCVKRNEPSVKYWYTGEEVVIEGHEELGTVYKWDNGDDNSDFQYCFSTNPASEIYFCVDGSVVGSDTTFYLSNGDRMYLSNIYIPQLNAPDSEQVDNAYIKSLDLYAYYKGAIEAHFTDGTLTLYRWERTDIYNYFTKYSANQQYNESTIEYGDSEDGLMLYYDSEQSGWYSEDLTVSQAEATMNQVVLPDYIDDYSTVKYQRTEVTEEWDWQPLTDDATNDDIDAMFSLVINEIKLIRTQEDDENYIDWLVNTSGETMEFNGQTYYKWVVWANDFNDGSGPAVENPNALVLTNTLNVQLPFNSNSPEFECRISIEGEEMTSQDYIHGDYTQKTVQ